MLALAGTVAFAGGVQAQADADQWFPFLGCWEPDAGAGPVMCIRPTPDGVELARIAEDQVVSREAITTRADAMDAADRINQVNQAVIGAKEGITDGIIAVVGKRVTDTVLRTADGTDDRAIDDYEIHDLLTAAAQ